MACNDYDGNPLAVGDKVWIPATVTSTTSFGTVGVQTAYNAQNISLPANATRKPRSFPDAP